MILNLVIVKTRILAPCRFRCIDLHLLHEIQLIFALVENIRHIVAGFRNDTKPGIVLKFRCTADAFIHILERPERHAAFGHILGRITGAEPAAVRRDSGRSIGCGCFLIREILAPPLLLHIAGIRHVTAAARQLEFVAGGDILAADILAGTVLIEEIECIGQQIMRGICVNVTDLKLQGTPFLILDPEEVSAGRLELREVDPANCIAGINIADRVAGDTGICNLIRFCIYEFIGIIAGQFNRLGNTACIALVVAEHGDLGTARNIAELIDGNIIVRDRAALAAVIDRLRRNHRCGQILDRHFIKPDLVAVRGIAPLPVGILEGPFLSHHILCAVKSSLKGLPFCRQLDWVPPAQSAAAHVRTVHKALRLKRAVLIVRIRRITDMGIEQQSVSACLDLAADFIAVPFLKVQLSVTELQIPFCSVKTLRNQNPDVRSAVINVEILLRGTGFHRMPRKHFVVKIRFRKELMILRRRCGQRREQ